MSVRPQMSLFDYDHLPPHLQEVSKRFHELAHWMDKELPHPETDMGLRKLLEAKDCAVRALVLRKKMEKEWAENKDKPPKTDWDTMKEWAAAQQECAGKKS